MQNHAASHKSFCCAPDRSGGRGGDNFDGGVDSMYGVGGAASLGTVVTNHAQQAGNAIAAWR